MLKKHFDSYGLPRQQDEFGRHCIKVLDALTISCRRLKAQGLDESEIARRYSRNRRTLSPYAADIARGFAIEEG